jgi:alpha-D-ribose 1-methylphosphonate 5-triphosphate synthase subunit PhnH
VLENAGQDIAADAMPLHSVPVSPVDSDSNSVIINLTFHTNMRLCKCIATVSSVAITFATILESSLEQWHLGETEYASEVLSLQRRHVSSASK